MAKRAGKQTSLIGSTEMKEPSPPLHEEGPQNAGDKKYEKHNHLLTTWLDANFRVEKTKINYYSAVHNFLSFVYPDDVDRPKWIGIAGLNKTERQKFKKRSRDKIEYFLDKYVADNERVFLDDFKTCILQLVKEEYAPNTIRASTGLLKKFFDRLNPEKYSIENRDFDDIKSSLLPARITVTKDEIPTKDELRLILTYLSVSKKALFLFLISTSVRIGAALQLKISDINLDVDLPYADIRPAYTKGGVGGRKVWFTHETRDALNAWLRVKDTFLKKSGAYFDRKLLFGMKYQTSLRSWNRALKKAGLEQRDPNTKLRIRKYHPHTLRKFFSTQMGDAGMAEQNIHALMGHKGYLSEAYKRPRELAKKYADCMHAVTIFEKDLDVQILEEKQALAEKVQGMTIQDDKIRRSLEMFGELVEIGDMKDLRTEDIIYTIESKVKDMMKTLAANAEEIAYLKETQGR